MPATQLAIRTGITMSEAAAVLPLFAWLSPAFPVGSYAYSHGLEWAVEAGDVTDEASLKEWLADFVRHGAGRNDAILLVHAHRAALAGNLLALAEANTLALAIAPTAELRLETAQQGRSFLDAVLAAWPNPALRRLAEAVAGETAYPVAVGLAAGAHDVPLGPAVNTFVLAVAQSLVSAALRLAPIGQTGGARVLAALLPTITRLADEAPDLPLDDLGSATFRADLGSCRHETQYTRLFRS
jgi:urease accessory protein